MAKEKISPHEEQTIVRRVVGRVRDRLTRTEQDLAKFRGKLVEDPAFALEWADSTFGDAARRRLYKAFLNGFDENAKLDDIRDYRENYLRQTMMIYVMSPSRSTSECANMYNAAFARECARLIELIGDCGFPG